MTNTYDEYAEKAAARYLQGRMDEQAAWVDAVKAEIGYSDRILGHAKGATARYHAARAAALDALLRRMGVE